MSSHDIPEDINVHFPLVLLRVSSHVVGIDEIACYFIRSKRLGETLGGLLVLCDTEDADFLGGFWGETSFLLESDSATAIGLRHDCG